MLNKFEALKDNLENSDSGDEEPASNNLDLGPLDYPAEQHRLQQPYWLWFSRRPSPPVAAGSDTGAVYSKALRLVAQIATVEQWWALYAHLRRLSELPPHTDLHLFKRGIEPLWEHAANARGGKWVVRLRKGQAGRAWENLCMAMLGEQFMAGGELCGAVISLRYQEDLLSLWNRTAADQAATARIRDTLRRVLHLPPAAAIEYKTHGDSLKHITPPINH